MISLTGKKALVTGAAGGIGGAIARTLHALGAEVTVSGTRADALEAVKAALGDRAHVCPCDLSDAAQVDGWIGAHEIRLSAEELDAIDAAIRRTGAGGGPGRPV